MNNNEIKVIKFVSGEEIVARIQLSEPDSVVSLSSPYVVQLSEEGLSLFPWILAADYSEHVNVSAISIVSIANPKEKIIEGYNNVVRTDAVEESAKDFEDELYESMNMTLH